jgi:hypothetical protein
MEHIDLTPRIRLWRGPRFKELLFAIDQGIDVVGRQLDIVAMRDCVSRARFHAVAAEYTSRIIDIVNPGVALTRRYAIRFRVFSGFNVNTIRRAGSGAEKTANAFFKTILVALQNVNSAIAWLNACRHIRIRFRRSFAKHRPQRHAEPLVEGKESFTDFFYD